MTRENEESAETVATTAGNIYRQARDQAASQAEYDLQGGLERLTRWMLQDDPALPAVSHAEVLHRVHAYLDGELDDLDYAVIRQHLDECAACLHEYGLEEVVKRMVQKHCGSDPAPAELRATISARIREVQSALDSARARRSS
jgi:mycothiol system anti-sigma-R factor